MTHPAIDQGAVDRLKAKLATAIPATEPTATAVIPPPSASSMASVITRAKAAVRQAAAPVVARVRRELADAAAQDQADLHAEVAALREALGRTRAEHAAELAALHEEVAAARRAIRARTSPPERT